MYGTEVSIGRIVRYYEGDMELAGAQRPMSGTETIQDLIARGRSLPGTNGHRDHPAIVTAVWSEGCVNLMVFFDARGVEQRNSASFLPDDVFGDGMHCVNSGWRWPDRKPEEPRRAAQ